MSWDKMTKDDQYQQTEHLYEQIDTMIGADIHPETLLEVGVSLIARGTFRYQLDKRVIDCLSSIINVLIDTKHDIMKQINLKDS